MPETDEFLLPTAEAAQLEISRRAIERKRKLAQELMNQMPQGVRLGSAVVPPHWTSFLSSGINQGLGREAQHEADSLEVQLLNRLKAQDEAQQAAATSFLSSLPAVEGLKTPSATDLVNPLTAKSTAEVIKQLIENPALIQKESAAAKLQEARDTASERRAQLTVDAADRRQQISMDAADRRQERSLAAADARAQRALDTREATVANKPLPAQAQKQQSALMNLESGLGAYEQAIANYNPQGTDATSIAKRNALGTIATDMRMRLKEAYELGAITGPDMAIIDKALTDPTSLQGTLKGAMFGREPFQAQTKEMRGVLNRLKGNFESQYNRSIPQAAATPSPPAFVPSQTKTINGKTYVKEGGKWYVQN